MKNYRLRNEAVSFFKKDIATAIKSIDDWNAIGVDVNALEEVEELYIRYGIPTGEKGKSLSGWDKDEGSHFHFTIVFPSVKHNEHDKFVDGKLTRELMNKVQKQLNTFYQDFINGNEE